MARRHASSLSSTGPPIAATPTLLCSTSMRPCAARVLATARATLCESVTSLPSARQVPPASVTARRVSSAAARSISATTMRAPSRAYATAAARPLLQPGPAEPAPKISAILSFSRLLMSSSHRRRLAGPAGRNAADVVLRGPPPPQGRESKRFRRKHHAYHYPPAAPRRGRRDGP